MLDYTDRRPKFDTRTSGILDNVSQAIGNTPLVRLSRLAKHCSIQAELLAKIEYFNPAGSIKDRSAKAMIDALIASGGLSEDSEIIEATSGNAGVACASLCAIYGIPLTIVIPEHMSVERQKLIRHYGAKVITTPKKLGTKGAIDTARALLDERPNAIVLDQFSNQANPDMHAKTTAEEIWRSCDGKLDMLVAGIGTGGTLTGIARAIKPRLPDLSMVAVEPASCAVLSTGQSGPHNIQGLSSGHIPDILDQRLIDEVVTVSDSDAVRMARQLARTEGLAVGTSSGAAMHAAIRLAARPANWEKRIVVICADTAERYFSTELFE